MNLRKSLMIITGCMLLHPVISQENDYKLNVEFLVAGSQYDQLLTLADSLTCADSTRAGYWYYKGLAANKLYRYKTALDAYNRAAKLDSSENRYLMSLAKVYTEMNNPGEAINIYQKITRQDSTREYAWWQLADLYLDQDYPLAALSIYNRVPDSLKNYYLHKHSGMACDKADSLKLKAVYHYMRAYELNEWDYSCLVRTANIFIANRQFENAILATNIGLRNDSLNKPLLKLKAYAFYHLNNFEESIKNFKLAGEYGDSSFFTRKYMGLAAFYHKDFPLAHELLEKANTMDPRDMETAVYYGYALCRDYHIKEGIKQLSDAIQLMYPDSLYLSEIHAELAKSHMYLTRPEQALHHYTKAYGLDNQNIMLVLHMAAIHDHHLKNYDTALSYYQLFLEKTGYDAETGNLKPGYENMDTHASWARERIGRIKEELFRINKGFWLYLPKNNHHR